MKYIKTYEVYSDDIRENLRLSIGKWLDKIKPTNSSMNWSSYERGYSETGVALKLKPSRYIGYDALIVRVENVIDKKLIGREISKLKVIVDCRIDEIDSPEIVDINGFLIDVFKKYAYFYKKDQKYRGTKFLKYGFFINVSDIDKILKDLNDDFELYIDTKKYNL